MTIAPDRLEELDFPISEIVLEDEEEAGDDDTDDDEEESDDDEADEDDEDDDTEAENASDVVAFSGLPVPLTPVAPPAPSWMMSPPTYEALMSNPNYAYSQRRMSSCYCSPSRAMYHSSAGYLNSYSGFSSYTPPGLYRSSIRRYELPSRPPVEWDDTTSWGAVIGVIGATVITCLVFFIAIML